MIHFAVAKLRHAQDVQAANVRLVLEQTFVFDPAYAIPRE